MMASSHLQKIDAEVLTPLILLDLENTEIEKRIQTQPNQLNASELSSMYGSQQTVSAPEEAEKV